MLNGWFLWGKIMEKKNQSHLWWFMPVILAETRGLLSVRPAWPAEETLSQINMTKEVCLPGSLS